MYAELAGDGLKCKLATDEQGMTVHQLLVNRLHLSPTFIDALISQGDIIVGRNVVISKEEVCGKRPLRFVGGVENGHADQSDNSSCEAKVYAPISVLYEDDHALVVNKPANLLVHPGDHELDTLKHRVIDYYEHLGIYANINHVHRLDYGTSGALLYAKHAYSLRTFAAMLDERDISRTYTAIVEGTPRAKEGRIALAIGRDRHMAGRYRVSDTGKPATTDYRTRSVFVSDSATFSLLEVRLGTGRTHQIRVHLAALGCPIVGDVLYHATNRGLDWSAGIALHACQLAFYNPYINHRVEVNAPVPAQWHSFVNQLRWDDAHLGD